MSDSTLNFDVSALADNTIEPGTNNDTELYLKFTGAKVKLNSIDELIMVIETINKRLGTLDDPELIRNWIHKVIRTHPEVDEGTKDLLFFKPVSEQIGSTYILHTPDTASLALEDWTTEKPIPIREVLKTKLDPNTYGQALSAYHDLNEAMVANISTEYFYERIEEAKRDQGNNYLNKSLLSNDFHIAGDYSFGNTLLGLSESLMNALIAYMGSTDKLLNWLFPINNTDEAISRGIKITVEGNDITVNLKGDKSGVIATVIDETPITPLECN